MDAAKEAPAKGQVAATAPEGMQGPSEDEEEDEEEGSGQPPPPPRARRKKGRRGPRRSASPWGRGTGPLGPWKREKAASKPAWP